MATHRILGISIGTTKIGIAVLQGNQIIEWKIKGFDAPWSPEKLERIITYLDHYTIVHPIKRIAIKVPALHSHTAAIKQLIQGIEHLGRTKKILVCSYTLSEMKEHWNGEQKITIGQLIKKVLENHPKFHKHYNRTLKTKIVHFEKLFEAIGAAHMLR